MEDSLITFLVLFGISVPTLALAYLAKFNSSKQKKAIKTVKEENFETIQQTYANTVKVLIEQNEFLVEENRVVKKKLAAEIGLKSKAEQTEIKQLQTPEIEITSDNLEEHYEIDVASGLKLVESMNLPLLKNMDKSKLPEMMNNRIVKSYIWNYIKKNKDEMIELGVILPKGQMVENTIKDSKTEDKKEENPSGMLELEFGQGNAKYMA